MDGSSLSAPCGDQGAFQRARRPEHDLGDRCFDIGCELGGGDGHGCGLGCRAAARGDGLGLQLLEAQMASCSGWAWWRWLLFMVGAPAVKVRKLGGVVAFTPASTTLAAVGTVTVVSRVGLGPSRTDTVGALDSGVTVLNGLASVGVAGVGELPRGWGSVCRQKGRLPAR